MRLTEHLVQGVDVWINTPRRPWEASGTSGMKVLVNGGVNLSELDGWWAEAYTPEVGWALGDGREHGDDPAWDAVEADALYELLEREVIPEFYARDAQRHSHRVGQARCARAWRSSRRASRPTAPCANTPSNTISRPPPPTVSARRTTAPSAKGHRGLAAGLRREVGRRCASARSKVEDERRAARVRGGGRPRRASTRTRCGSSSMPTAPRGSARACEEMVRARRLAGAPGRYVYARRCPRPAQRRDYTARVIPRREGVAVPLEIHRILWQR